MTQAQFNLTEGQRLKTEGMALASEHADEEWKWFFWFHGKVVAARKEPFTTEDILCWCGLPSRPNAIGAAMNSLARELKLTKVGYRKAKRPSRHAAVVAIWQLI
jgi:hypothetical protein